MRRTISYALLLDLMVTLQMVLTARKPLARRNKIGVFTDCSGAGHIP